MGSHQPLAWPPSHRDPARGPGGPRPGTRPALVTRSSNLKSLRLARAGARRPGPVPVCHTRKATDKAMVEFRIQFQDSGLPPREKKIDCTRQTDTDTATDRDRHRPTDTQTRARARVQRQQGSRHLRQQAAAGSLAFPRAPPVVRPTRARHTRGPHLKN